MQLLNLLWVGLITNSQRNATYLILQALRETTIFKHALHFGLPFSYYTLVVLKGTCIATICRSPHCLRGFQ
ncbi:Uncharacterized protein TCM_011952 [Theobroma cacao]|uniref:Uncharacterized protein n=1 Tax=Theobroma cacao TaxID=3641 RepID=A0A061FTZ3_THECC|nr:Uncharacterized protein TCM_011952 [Theobroma cacao]